MWQIRYGLGGSFGGCDNMEWENTDAKDEQEAEQWAFEQACEEYNSYAGIHGIRSVEEIMEEENVEEFEAEEIYNEDRETWIDYRVREI